MSPFWLSFAKTFCLHRIPKVSRRCQPHHSTFISNGGDVRSHFCLDEDGAQAEKRGGKEVTSHRFCEEVTHVVGSSAEKKAEKSEESPPSDKEKEKTSVEEPPAHSSTQQSSEPEKEKSLPASEDQQKEEKPPASPPPPEDKKIKSPPAQQHIEENDDILDFTPPHSPPPQKAKAHRQPGIEVVPEKKVARKVGVESFAFEVTTIFIGIQSSKLRWCQSLQTRSQCRLHHRPKQLVSQRPSHRQKLSPPWERQPQQSLHQQRSPPNRRHQQQVEQSQRQHQRGRHLHQQRREREQHVPRSPPLHAVDWSKFTSKEAFLTRTGEVYGIDPGSAEGHNFHVSSYYYYYVSADWGTGHPQSHSSIMLRNDSRQSHKWTCVHCRSKHPELADHKTAEEGTILTRKIAKETLKKCFSVR